MIAIIDYGAGNIKSVEKACLHLGADVVVTNDPKVISDSDKAILPGVGSFGWAMERIRDLELFDPITQYCMSGKPFLGICLGLQLLFSKSEESEGVSGLDILKGEIKRIPDTNGLTVPHMGWNSLDFPNRGRLFSDEDKQPFVYFVHSYYLEAQNPEIVVATCDYGVKIDAAVESGNVFATQFHPEKSGQVGLDILKRFISL